MSKLKYWVIMMLLFITVGMFWEGVSSRWTLPRILVSSPSLLLHYLSEHWSRLILDFMHTLSVATVGLILALILGFSLAYIGTTFQRLERPLILISSIVQTIPLLVFVPFLVILLGPNFASKAILACIMALFVIIVSTLVTLEKVKKEYEDFLELYEVPKFRRYTDVLIPIGLASIAGTVRVAAGLSVLGAIVAEFTGSAYGLGKNIFLASVRLEPELMMISVILCSLLGVGIHFTFVKIENKLFWWRSPEKE